MPSTRKPYSAEFREKLKDFVTGEISINAGPADGYVERIARAMTRYDEERAADSLTPRKREKIVDEIIEQADQLLNGLQILDGLSMEMFKKRGVGAVKVQRELMALKNAAEKIKAVLGKAGEGARKGGRPSDPYRKTFIRALSKIYEGITGKRAIAWRNNYNRGGSKFQNMVALCIPDTMEAPPSPETIRNDLKG